MSQNNPPENNQNRPDADGRDDDYRNQSSQHEAQNPYYARAQAQTVPDLDASAPELRSVEDRRLNRKALFFLAAIVLVLVVLAFFLYQNALNRNATEVKKEPTTAISAPSLPKMADVPPPVEQQQAAPPIDLAPPLPPQDPTTYSAPIRQERERPAGPTLAERRMASAGGASPQASGNGEMTAEQYSSSLLSGLTPAQGQGDQVGGDAGASAQKISNAQFIRHPDALLVRGTYLRCILETRVITDLAGFTSCLITEPVYSINGRTLLLPKGSKIYGSYGGAPTGKRVAVVWDRITTPTGIDVAMSSPGTDNLGGAGHPGQYNAHWGARISSALMISLLSDAFKYAAAEYGPETTTVSTSGVEVQSPYESATARTMERIANEAVSENMKRPPTVTINQGSLINVYVAKDVDFTNVLPRK